MEADGTVQGDLLCLNLADGKEVWKYQSKPNIKRAISPMPVVKPIRVTGPNSVFELGTVFAKS